MKRKLSIQESAVQRLDSALHNLPDREHDDLVLEVAAALKVRRPESLERDVKGAELVITKTSGKFLCKKTTRGQIIEIARCDKIEEALQALISDKDYKGQRSQNEDEMWCTGCLDDPTVEHCAFCGCRKCYGKKDSSNILVCDGCDEEWHTYCLNPPLESVPHSEEWFCVKCSVRRERESAAEALKNDDRRVGVEVVEKKKKRPTGRPRGRPPSAGKKNKKAAAGAAAEEEDGNDEGGNSSKMPVPYSVVEQRSRAPTPVDEAPHLDAVGVDAALAIIAQTGSERALSRAERDFLAQLRFWGSWNDLQTVKDALIHQCQALQKQLASTD